MDADSMSGAIETVWDHRMPRGRLDKKGKRKKSEKGVDDDGCTY